MKGWIAGAATAAVFLAATVAALGAGPALDLTTKTIPGYGISLGVPSTWKGSEPPAPDRKLGLVYFYRDLDPTASFHTNVNVIVTPLPHGMTLRQWLFAGASASMAYVGKTTVATVGGTRGLHYESTKAIKAGTQPLFTDEYAVVRDGHVLLFTYTALATDQAQYEATFAASARSIRLSAHPVSQTTA